MLLQSCQNGTPVNSYCLIDTPIYDYEILEDKDLDDLYIQITQHNRTDACLCENLTKEEKKEFKCEGN